MGGELPVRQYRAGMPGVLIIETCYRYEPKRRDENGLIADWLLALTDVKKTGGFGLCFLHLRNVKGFKWNWSSPTEVVLRYV